MVKPPDQEVAAKYKVNAEFMVGDVSSKNPQNLVNAYANNDFKLHIDKTSPFNLEEMKKAHVAFALKQNVGKWLIKFK